MDKYREPCSPEQWKCCVESIKVGTVCIVLLLYKHECLRKVQASDSGTRTQNGKGIAVQELADVAADYGIDYGLEVVNRYETNICNTGVQVHISPIAPCIQILALIIMFVASCSIREQIYTL